MLTSGPSPLSPNVWMQDLFASKAAQRGQVIRRKKRDIERIVGLEVFANEVARRGYLAVENAGQVIVFCNREPVKKLNADRPAQ